jgi:hypothetical protein
MQVLYQKFIKYLKLKIACNLYTIVVLGIFQSCISQIIIIFFLLKYLHKYIF